MLEFLVSVVGRAGENAKAINNKRRKLVKD
jgi:hypothetical protein